MTPLDAPLVPYITGFVGQLPFLDRVVRLVVNDFFIPVTVFMLLVWLWFASRDPLQRRRDQYGVMWGSTAAGFGNLFLHFINRVSFWPRPFVEFESARRAAETLFYMPPDPSFPSNPATITFATATSLWFVNRRAGAVVYALGIIWSLARVYAGVHYLTDIVGGAALGVFTAFVICKLFFPLIAPLPALFLSIMRRLYLA